MRARIVGIENEGAAHPLHCQIVAARLSGNDAEQVQRPGMVRLHGADFAIECFSVLQAPGTMVRESQFEVFVDRSRRHGRHSEPKPRYPTDRKRQPIGGTSIFTNSECYFPGSRDRSLNLRTRTLHAALKHTTHGKTPGGGRPPRFPSRAHCTLGA